MKDNIINLVNELLDDEDGISAGAFIALRTHLIDIGETVIADLITNETVEAEGRIYFPYGFFVN